MASGLIVAATAATVFSPICVALRWRRLRVSLIYWWRHGHWPDLRSPRRFTEWVQWRKLNDRHPALARLTDKMWSKDTVAERGLGQLAVPTLWSGTDLPDRPPAALPLIVKSNHGCNHWRVVRTLHEWRAARPVAAGWLGRAYGRWLDEEHYRTARRLILVEPFLDGPGGGLPEDYKVYVFGGRAAIVQHHVGRGGAHRWTQYDRDWTRVGGAGDVQPPPPTLSSMIEAAERLGAGHDFLRVDFYDIAGRLWFGEFCLFPGSGLDPFDPPELDEWLGDLWSAARRD